MELATGTGLGLLPTRTHNGRTMIGHVVVCQGAGEDGEDVIAVWQVNTEGVNTGAWVVPVAEAYTEPDAAGSLLNKCVKRAVTAWDPSASISVLTVLEAVARVGARDWAATMVTLPAALTEIGAIRSAYDKRITEERQTRKNIVAPEWKIDILDPISATADEFRVYAGLARQPGCAAIQEALLTTSLVRWCVQRWRENMTVLGRRGYLQESFGHPRMLPPDWETHLADAYVQGAQPQRPPA